jgi:trimethylamine--corrinoid protein Co-methyltransferase
MRETKMSRPKLELLDRDAIERILAEAHELLWDPGVRIHSDEALKLLADAGATVDFASGVAHIPSQLVDQTLETVPPSFYLYDYEGNPAVHYGDDDVQFDPGSAAIEILDYGTTQSRKPVTADFVAYIKLAEMLPELDAVSTALVCSDVPKSMADLYRLYLVLKYARKPVITGAFAVETWSIMRDLLMVVVGSEEALAAKPIAVFDVCPSPPLLWSEITCQNMMDCARTGIPAELVSMPLAGATGPATLVGSVVQHAAECLSGLTIHQLAKAGSPIVWGGSPAAFDMRTGTPPMGAIETLMMDCAYVQVGKYLGLPTHAYMGMSDAKIVDAQAGFESGIGNILAVLAGVNMVSGAGMLDFESCFSLEKLVIDNELIGMARRLVRGIDTSEDPVATVIMRQVGHAGNFLATEHTRQWFKQELFIPSPVIDRDYRQAWEGKGAKDIVQRARERVQALIAEYQSPKVPDEVCKGLKAIMTRAAKQYGMDELPPLPEP